MAALSPRGADVNTTADNGDTLLHDAVRSVSRMSLDLILSEGANPALNKYGKTPLDSIQPGSPFLQVMSKRCPRLEFARPRLEEAYTLKRVVLLKHGAPTSDELKQAETMVNEKAIVDLCEEQVAMLDKSDGTPKTNEEDK